MIAGIILLSVVAIFATLGLTAAGVDLTEGIFPTIVALPAIGLPLGFALVVVLLIMSVIKRGRAAKDVSN